MKVDRPNQRRPDGNIVSMMKDENWYELVAGRQVALGRPVGHLGSDVRAGRARTAIRSASGTSRPARSTRTSPRTGRSTTTCATSSRRDWTTLGPKLANKINVYVGDADSYFLNMGVHLLDEFLQQSGQPEVDRRDRLSADGAALLGPAAGRADGEDGGADHEVRAGGRGRHELEVLMNTRRQFLIKAPLGFLVATAACDDAAPTAPQSAPPATPTAARRRRVALVLVPDRRSPRRRSPKLRSSGLRSLHEMRSRDDDALRCRVALS